MDFPKTVVILSGGMDSSTLIYDVVNQRRGEVIAISFDYGQKHVRELKAAKKICKSLGVEHKIFDLSILNKVAVSSLTRNDIEVPKGRYTNENMKSTVVPNRNMVMLSIAASFAISVEADELYYGAHAGDHEIYPDCRPKFVLAMRKVITLADSHMVTLKVPYLNTDKAGILKKGLKLNIDYKDTWTCYKGGGKACGKCGSCVERLEAFEKNNVKDPLEYRK